MDSSQPSPIRAQRLPDQRFECERHGPYIAQHILRSVFSRCPQCEAERAVAEAAQREAEAEQRRQQRHREMLETAAIPSRFVGRNFANFATPTPAHQRAVTVCRDFAEGFDDHARKGSGLILAGMPGTGKSHLAAAILQHLLSRDVRYATCMDLIRAVRDTWRRDSDRTETKLLRYLERLDLLAIDEVGMQYGTEGEQTILFDVLDRRYREMKPTLILTNQDKDGLREFVGDRTFDRLVETCRWVPFDWPSYRPTARKAAA